VSVQEYPPVRVGPDALARASATEVCSAGRVKAAAPTHSQAPNSLQVRSIGVVEKVETQREVLAAEFRR